eukprot:3889767-Rhodomonas_salina.1
MVSEGRSNWHGSAIRDGDAQIILLLTFMVTGGIQQAFKTTGLVTSSLASVFSFGQAIDGLMDLSCVTAELLTLVKSVELDEYTLVDLQITLTCCAREFHSIHGGIRVA